MPDQDLPVWYPDADGDGYGDEDAGGSQCDRPVGYVENAEDCDDGDPEIHPGAEDPCDGIDADCTGGPWDEVDDDGDGLSECEGDCIDTTADAYPGAQEICNGLDDDCDGSLPSDELDVDGDGAIACLDCDDTTQILAPGNIEVCGDGLDNDCDGAADNDCYECDLVVPFDFATIQQAIDSAGTGDVVCVESGTWYELLNFNGAEITLLGPHGAEETILSGLNQGTVVRFDSGEGATTTMQGFTVQGGVSWDFAVRVEAGGIEISGASPTLVELMVTGNDATAGSGGGIRVAGGSPTMTRLIVFGNDASMNGGGISVQASTLSLESVVIEDNSADWRGGGLDIDDSDVAVANSRISGNGDSVGGPSYCGGGVYAGGSSVTITNAMITDNSTFQTAGGGVCVENSWVSITNTLIDYNSANFGGAGLQVVSGSPSTVSLTNVVVAYNGTILPDHYQTVGINAGSDSLVCSHSDIYGNDGEGYNPVGTDGNISVPPGIYEPSGHLTAISPLIDAGDPAILDPDGSVSDIGLFGGPGADDIDLDFDGFPSWWLPGPYDPATSPGLDCDDDDALVYPGAGC